MKTLLYRLQYYIIKRREKPTTWNTSQYCLLNDLVIYYLRQITEYMNQKVILFITPSHTLRSWVKSLFDVVRVCVAKLLPYIHTVTCNWYFIPGHSYSAVHEIKIIICIKYLACPLHFLVVGFQWRILHLVTHLTYKTSVNTLSLFDSYYDKTPLFCFKSKDISHEHNDFYLKLQVAKRSHFFFKFAHQLLKS